MSEIQRSKEYNSKTGKWETMSFKVNKKGDVSVAPKRKEMAKKMATKEPAWKVKSGKKVVAAFKALAKKHDNWETKDTL